MACYCLDSEELKEQKRKSREIDRWLREDAYRLRREHKILLFGADNSGKSTFLKQMRIIYGDGYNDEDKRKYVDIVYQNVFVAMCQLIRAIKMLGIAYKHAVNENNASMILPYDYKNITKEDFKTCEEALKSLWSDPGMAECYTQRHKFKLVDSAKYFLDALERISRDFYLPTLSDILHATDDDRVTAINNVNECLVEVDGFRARILEYGSRLSRRVRMHLFENVTAIIFFAALNENDVLEDEYEKLMEQHCKTFRAQLSNKWWCSYDFTYLLFLNKKDLFEEKIMVSSLANYFPAYDGPEKDPLAAMKFIQEMSVSMSADDPDRRVHSYFTCSTDTDDMRAIFRSVRESLTDVPSNYYNMV